VPTDFHGVFSAMATPFDAAGALDEVELRAGVNRAIEAGVHGLAPCGSTGEFTLLSADERKRLVEVVCEEAAGRIPTVVHTGALTTAEAVALSRHAAEAGAAGVFAVIPFYEPLELDDVRGFYEALAEAVDVPVGIYNLPVASGVDLDSDWVGALAREDDRIAFIKDTTGSFDRVSRLVVDHGDVITVFNGDDTLLLPAFVAGAPACLLGTLNVLPAECAGVYDAYAAGRYEEAEALYRRILPVSLFLTAGHYYSAGVKAGLDLIGHSAGDPRLPILPLGDERRAQLRGLLDAVGAPAAA
jgi:4-hydroxy-tetrahydrodipicolinate synthase